MGVKAKLKAIAERAEIATTFPDMICTWEPVEQYTGLKVHSVSGCPHCPYAVTKKKVQAHLKKEHANLGNKVEEGVMTQVLNPSNTWSHFRIKPHPTKDLEQEGNKYMDLGQESRNFDWKSFVKSNSKQLPNARLVSPWLMCTRWDEHVLGKNLEELSMLVALPKENEFHGLAKVVKAYFDKATDLLDAVDELVLQHLSSAHPTKE